MSSTGFIVARSIIHSLAYDESVRVSTRGDYACRALLSMAIRDDRSKPVSVRDIAERTALPQPYLEQILGGYMLSREPEDIRLSAVVSAVDGPIVAGDFGQPHTDGACDHEGQCVLLAVWGHVGEQMRELLDSFTLADVAEMANGDRTWPPTIAAVTS